MFAVESAFFFDVLLQALVHALQSDRLEPENFHQWSAAW